MKEKGPPLPSQQRKVGKVSTGGDVTGQSRKLPDGYGLGLVGHGWRKVDNLFILDRHHDAMPCSITRKGILA